jgi:anti-sigma regulatory factor (Ser/Thr protein kinase)
VICEKGKAAAFAKTVAIKLFSGLPQGPRPMHLPSRFDTDTMRQFIFNSYWAARNGKITFSFQKLRHIDPAGVVVLSNLLQAFGGKGVDVSFVDHDRMTEATKYLDDAGFFKNYLGEYVFSGSARRSTTMPLELFEAKKYLPYLYRQLMPWIAQEVQLHEDTLDTIKTCLEEIFHNIDYHSGVSVGGTFSQHFPRANTIDVAISDFGVGIPKNVRTVLPDLNDGQAIEEACQLGFTTKSNVANRGWGLPNLIRYVVERNSGRVSIHSARGYFRAYSVEGKVVTFSQQLQWPYPGTLVHVVLRTDTLERLENDVAPEEFQW